MGRRAPPSNRLESSIVGAAGTSNALANLSVILDVFPRHGYFRGYDLAAAPSFPFGPGLLPSKKRKYSW